MWCSVIEKSDKVLLIIPGDDSHGGVKRVFVHGGAVVRDEVQHGGQPSALPHRARLARAHQLQDLQRTPRVNKLAHTRTQAH